MPYTFGIIQEVIDGDPTLIRTGLLPGTLVTNSFYGNGSFSVNDEIFIPSKEVTKIIGNSLDNGDDYHTFGYFDPPDHIYLGLYSEGINPVTTISIIIAILFSIIGIPSIWKLISGNKEREKKLKTPYHRRSDLEKRTSRWLMKNFGMKTILNDSVKGKLEKTYHVDIHAIKKTSSGVTHLWVECRATKVSKKHFRELISTSEEVNEVKNDGLNTWNPDILLMVSDTGYYNNALEWVNNKNIFCVLSEKEFKFVSKKKLEDSKNGLK